MNVKPEQFVHYQGFSSLTACLSQTTRNDVIVNEAFDAMADIADKHDHLIVGGGKPIKDENGMTVGYEVNVAFFPKGEYE